MFRDLYMFDRASVRNQVPGRAEYGSPSKSSNIHTSILLQYQPTVKLHRPYLLFNSLMPAEPFPRPRECLTTCKTQHSSDMQILVMRVFFSSLNNNSNKMCYLKIANPHLHWMRGCNHSAQQNFAFFLPFWMYIEWPRSSNSARTGE